MKKFICLVILFAIAVQMLAQNVYHDVRVIHDVATLRLDAIIGEKSNAWQVLQFTPTKTSGSSTGLGAYIQAETGKLVVPPGSEGAIIREGSWKLILAVNGPATANEGRYSWTEPERTKRRVDPEDVFSVFVQGGVAFCRHDPSLKASAEFEPLYVIPAKSEKDLQAAYEYFNTNAELFSSQIVPSSRDRLAMLLEGDNEILSVLALRRLVETKNLDEAQINAALQSAKNRRKAFFIYILLGDLEKTGEKTVPVGIRQSVVNAGNADAIRQIALGCFAARVFHSTSRSVRSAIDQLVPDLQMRVTDLGLASDEYLRAVFNAMGVKEKK